MDQSSTPQRISLRDIARLANVSHSTVSLALRNNPAIAAKTRQRIQELAVSLGYVPDPMLRALAEYRRDKSVRRYQGSLAWINNHPNPASLDTNSEMALYRQGAEQRAAELGYNLVVFRPAAERMSSTALRRVLINNGIRGLLLPPQPQSHTVLDFDFSGFSAVSFGFSISSPQLHVVTNHQFHSSVLALKKLSALGFKRVGFVLSEDLNERSEGNFLGGFLVHQSRLTPASRVPVFLSRNPKEEQNVKKFEHWFQAHRPDVLLADFPEWAITFLEHMSLRVPEDVPLAILGAVPNRHRFAGISQNDFKIGQLAVDTIVGMIYRNETGLPRCPTRILAEGEWQDGESIPKI